MIHMHSLLLAGGLVIDHYCFGGFKANDFVHGAPMLLKFGGALLSVLGVEIPYIVANFQSWWGGSAIIQRFLTISFYLGIPPDKGECLV